MFDNMQKAIDLNRLPVRTPAKSCFLLRSVPVSHAWRAAKHTQTSRGRGNRQSALRHNAVEIFDEVNTGKNTGAAYRGSPGISSPTVTMRKSNLHGRRRLHATWPIESVNAVKGYEGVVKFVFENISTLAVNPVRRYWWALASLPRWKPPQCLAKSHFAPDWQPPPQSESGKLELRLEEGLNRLGIGPQGLLATVQ